MIAITGSTGFVGKNLIAYLSESDIPYIPLTRAEFAQGDYAKLDRCNAVVHLAGKAHDLKNDSAPEEYNLVNFELTKNLFEAFVRSDCNKFIFVSSVKACADHTNITLTEDVIPDPKTPYGLSKLRAEKFMQGVVLPTGKSLYILRPCMVHGPGNRGNLNLLYQFVSKGLPYPLAAFENQRSFLSVDNLCFVIKELLEREDIPSDVYHIADDEPLSTTEIVSLLSEALGRSPRLWKIPVSIVNAMAKAGDMFKLPLNSDRLIKLTENYPVSNRKIREVLKKELPLSSREGILKTAQSFKTA